MRECTPVTEKDVADYIDAIIVPTCGNLFRNTRLRGVYPIPEFPEVFGDGSILDIGCNWGRWSIAGAKAGYRMIGIDIHLKSLLCAQWLSRRLSPGNEPIFVLADARHMPFSAASLDGVFSYGVIQHFSRENAGVILSEVSRIMKPQAKSVIQMPNRAGVRSLMILARRGFSDGSAFDVRYYSISDLVKLFENRIGKTEWDVDCFLGLNVHACDRGLVSPSKRWIIDLAEVLRSASEALPFVRNFSDSVFVTSTKS
jgi:SAM-dependent methyltransferase